MGKLRVLAQAVRGWFDTSRDHWMLCIDLRFVTLFIEQGQFVMLVCYDQSSLCISELVRHQVHFWLLAHESEVDALIVFTYSHISQCFSVCTSLNDETENWHSHRVHFVLGIVLHCGASIFWYSTSVYLELSRALYCRVKSVFCASHTIPEEPNSTMRHIDDLASVSNGHVSHVFEFKHIA